MGDQTRIQWADATWNPFSGCTPVSEGCSFCYAKRTADRLASIQGSGYDVYGFEPCFHHDRLGIPAKWKRPRRVFVCSMSDLFHPGHKRHFVDMVFDTMEACPQHTFMVLTKRPDQMWEYMSRYGAFAHPKNIWLGVTVESYQHMDRVDVLLQTPAAVRFVSVEPMLTAVLFREPDYSDRGKGAGHLVAGNTSSLAVTVDWVICGSESGSPRHMKVAWAQALCRQVQAAGKPFFYKQGPDEGTGVVRHMPYLFGRQWAQFPDGEGGILCQG